MMKKYVASAVLILGFSVVAEAATASDTWYQNRFVRRSLPFQANPQTNTGTGKSYDQGSSGGTGLTNGSQPDASGPTGSNSTGNTSSGDNWSGNNSSRNSSTGGSSTGGNSSGNNSIGNNSSGNNSSGDNATGNSSAGSTGGNSSSNGNPPSSSWFNNLYQDLTSPDGSGKTSNNIVAPEIDPASGLTALGLLSAALLMLRGRR